MAGPNELGNIFELVDGIKPYIRGVCALIHDSDENSKEANYLFGVNNELGGGHVIFGSYCGDHSHSRNRILKETGIKRGDKLVSLDLMERVPVEFAQQFEQIFTQMDEKGVDVANFYSKPYLMRYREDMLYIGTPHESLVCMNLFGTELKRVELNQYFPDENKVRVNMRPIKRDNYHHIDHYVKYLLQPNSNQNILGLEHRGGNKNLARYEEMRLNLICMLEVRGLPRTVDGVKELCKDKRLDIWMKEIINENGWMNNFYRYHILGEREGVKDTHDWSNLPQF